MGKRQLTPRHQAYVVNQLNHHNHDMSPEPRPRVDLDSSWHLCAAAAAMALLAFVGLIISLKAPLPGDADYRLVREPSKV